MTLFPRDPSGSWSATKETWHCSKQSRLNHCHVMASLDTSQTNTREGPRANKKAGKVGLGQQRMAHCVRIFDI